MIGSLTRLGPSCRELVATVVFLPIMFLVGCGMSDPSWTLDAVKEQLTRHGYEPAPPLTVNRPPVETQVNNLVQVSSSSFSADASAARVHVDLYQFEEGTDAINSSASIAQVYRQAGYYAQSGLNGKVVAIIYGKTEVAEEVDKLFEFMKEI